MKKSVKKLSMLAMLSVVIGSNLNATVTPIKVINLPSDNSIAAQVESGNSIQTPVNGYYNLDSDSMYYAIKRTTHTHSYATDTVIQNTKQFGSKFIGYEGGTWDIATNTISK